EGEWVWIGGKEGLVRMTAARAEPAGAAPRVEIREAQASGRMDRFLPLKPRGEIEIASDVEHIRFFFSPAEPMDPGSEFYETRLQPIESSWSGPTSANAREFTGLSPGHYV